MEGVEAVESGQGFLLYTINGHRNYDRPDYFHVFQTLVENMIATCSWLRGPPVREKRSEPTRALNIRFFNMRL